MAVANRISDNTTILLGDGNGGFSAASGSPAGVGDGPASVVAGDFNLDGKPDLAVVNELSDNMTILLNTDLPPSITCPTDQVVPATSSAGAVLAYPAPAVADDCPGVMAVCSPPSSTFLIGTTTVTCTATDSAFQQTSCTFTVHVKGAVEQIDDLIALVQSFNLKSATANSLIAKLQAAAGLLSKGNVHGACGYLKDFINLVNAQRDKKQITPAQATQMINDATRIRMVLGC